MPPYLNVVTGDQPAVDQSLLGFFLPLNRVKIGLKL